MQRVWIALVVTIFLAAPLVQAQNKTEIGEYKIKTMAENNNWVMVEKRQRIGAGSTVYYLRKDMIVSIVVEYPKIVKITMNEKIEYKMDFISNPTANQFVKDLVASL